MDNRKDYIKTGISRWDLFTIGLYWLIVAPLIYYYNTHSGQQFSPGKYLPFLVLTVFMDTLAVISLVFYVPQLWHAGSTWHSLTRLGAISLLLLTICGFGFLYMMAYRQLYFGVKLITWSTWIGGIVQHVRSYGLLLVITYFRKTQADKRRLLGTILDKEREEGEKLRNRISPHFLTNALNGIQPNWVSEEGTPYLDKVMEMMQYFTYSCSRKSIPQEEEIEFIKTYLDLMTIGLVYPENLEAAFFIREFGNQITPGILVQLLENALKHGGKGQDDHIKLELTIDDGILYFMLSNAIVGNTIESHFGGAGMAIVLRTLELHYRSSYEFYQFIEHQEYHVHLIIHLKRSN